MFAVTHFKVTRDMGIWSIGFRKFLRAEKTTTENVDTGENRE